jgi:LysM repeat protein
LGDCEFYPLVERKKLENIDVEFQVEVGYWASLNHLQDYKIYGTMIKQIFPKFLNNLQQPLGNHLWPTHSTNQNYKTQFHR